MSIADALRVGRRAVRSVVGRDLFYLREVRTARLRLGRPGASWCVCPAGLGPSSVVYSFGIGEDVSFELALIERFDLRVYAFDPTPRSLTWVRAQHLPPRLTVNDVGLAAWDGTACFIPPPDPAHVSYSMVDNVPEGSAVEAPVRRLSTLAAGLGHSRIDVLKMDIEGAEYAALPDCLRSGVEIDQLLIEFHHRWNSIGIAETRRTISLLRNTGYLIADVSPSGYEYSFLRTGRGR